MRGHGPWLGPREVIVGLVAKVGVDVVHRTPLPVPVVQPPAGLKGKVDGLGPGADRVFTAVLERYQRAAKRVDRRDAAAGAGIQRVKEAVVLLVAEGGDARHSAGDDASGHHGKRSLRPVFALESDRRDDDFRAVLFGLEPARHHVVFTSLGVAVEHAICHDGCVWRRVHKAIRLVIARQNAGHNGAVAVVAAVYGVASVSLVGNVLSSDNPTTWSKASSQGGMVVVDLFCLLASALFRDAGEATYTSVNDSNLDATS